MTSRLKYDVCSVDTQNRISTGPARYHLEPMRGLVSPGFVADPSIRMHKFGVSHKRGWQPVDVESELWIKKHPRECDSELYNPEDNRLNRSGNRHERTIDFTVAYPRQSNPPATLRGTGINRFQWLHQDPQAHVIEPFAWQIQTRIAEKDMHVLRKCYGKPADQSGLWPSQDQNRIMKVTSAATIGVVGGELAAPPGPLRTNSTPGGGDAKLNLKLHGQQSPLTGSR